MVAQGGASDSGHTRNPGETEEVIPAPEGRRKRPCHQNIQADLPSPFQGCPRWWFSRTLRVLLRFTLGYDFVALSGLKAALCVF